MRRAVGALLVAALVAAGAATASGCGGGTVDPVAKAATITGQTRGAQLAATFTFTFPGSAQAVTMPASGTFDFRGRRGVVELDLSKLAALTGGRVTLGTMEERIVYPNIYLRAPFLTKAIAGNKRWLKVDLQAAAKRVSGLNLSQLTTQSTPADQLQTLRASGNVHRVGTDIVRRVTTTHYRGDVDLRKLVDRVPPPQRKATQQGVDRLIKLTGASTYPVDVWVDAQHRVRRMYLAMTLSLPTGQRMSYAVKMDFFNFGIKPLITAPPPDQVFDATGSLPSQ